MWNVRQLETRQVEYDFSSDGLGPFSAMALIADGHVIANQIGNLELAPDGGAQVLICEHCGIVHCQPGGWIAQRRVGASLLWLPCVDRLPLEASHEYRPPPFLVEYGALFFDAAAAERLAELIPLFSPGRSQDLTNREAALLIQCEAPGRALGKPGDPLRVRRELVLAAQIGAVDEQLDRLDALLALSSHSSQPAELCEGKSTALYLDLPGTPEWYPLAINTHGEMVLALQRDLGLVVVGEPA